MTMSDSITLSLPATARTTTNKASLSTQIQQIIAQKGAFRHLNERTLQDEIQRSSDGSIEDESSLKDEGEKEEDESESVSARQEKLWKGREELLQHLNRAQNEILCALDFVSFVISKQYVPAQSSMSPLLKQSVPVGSIESHVLTPQHPSATLSTTLATVAHGWKADSFRKASETLALASSRLQSEAKRESRFWEQIADLQKEGWSVSRLPRDSRAIGVHFGFAESAPQFRNRGFALHRQNDEGGLYINLSLASERRKSLKVYVRRGQQSGSHMVTSLAESSSGVLKQIREIRNSLFEEELFYEICREARASANRGFRTRAGAVEVNIDTELQIAIEWSDEELKPSQNSRLGSIANFIGLSLQSLLLLAHEDNLARRSRPPAPISSRPSSNPEYALLRPIIAALRHQTERATFKRHCSTILKYLQQNKLEAEIEEHISQSTDDQFQGKAQFGISCLLPRSKSIINLHLPSKRVLHITLQTHLGPPLYGTRFQLSHITYPFASIKVSTHDTEESALSNICHIVMLDLLSIIQANYESSDDHGVDSSRNKPKSNRTWRVTKAHCGEFVFQVKEQIIKKARLDLTPKSLKLSELADDQQISNIWLWTADGRSFCRSGREIKSNTQTVLEIIEQLGSGSNS